MKTVPYRSRSLAPGIVISLLIHAGLGALLLSQRPPVQRTSQPARWLTVSILPTPAPKPAPEPPPPLVEPRRQPVSPHNKPAAIAHAPAMTAARQRDKEDNQKQQAAITVIPASPNEPPDPFAAPTAKGSGTFDTAAALQSARKLAVAKAGKDDPAVAQLRDKPINDVAGENELGKGIKQGARPDCLMSGAGAGLLAPLVIAARVLTDKKDHGCKW
ncbi:hypothetical protein GCM10027277_06840 [Pseudoduganella ginsengisoli]|uniref:Uncharacterized protein n=1 Tax=Pseudoduganella ginsengisoli TaxID=1462440 RepID=A0A6L6Q5U4_9BURK|nr:hypothetical protein [Pseudoduganella ginsengisoli]MTW05253.1 hypothetical protein [Pseudoduganella ginsengisoli]